MVGEIQVRNLFIVTSSSATTTAAIKAAGTKLNGAIVESDGTAASADNNFLLSLINNQGKLASSDELSPSRILYAKSVAYQARTLGLDTISGITAEANKLYQIRITSSQYGSLSVENEYIKEAFYKSKTGDTVEDIVDGLIKSLYRNLSREEPQTGEFVTYTLADTSTVSLPTNAYFTFEKGATTQTIDVDTAPTADASATVTLNGTDVTVALLDADTDAQAATKIASAIDAVDGYSAAAVGTVVTITSDAATVVTYDAGTTGTTVTQAYTSNTSGIVITEKSTWLGQYYVTGKKTRLSFPYTVEAHFPTAPTVATTKGFEGVATGYHVRNMEEYYLGNRGDTFREMGYPHNFEREYDSVLSQAYYLIELGYYDESRDEPMKSKKQLTIACPNTTVANTLIGQINTALTNTVFSISTF